MLPNCVELEAMVITGKPRTPHRPVHGQAGCTALSQGRCSCTVVPIAVWKSLPAFPSLSSSVFIPSAICSLTQSPACSFHTGAPGPVLVAHGCCRVNADGRYWVLLLTLQTDLGEYRFVYRWKLLLASEF